MTDQEDYDEGYKDGRKSRDAEIEGLRMQLEWARKDLDTARIEAQRLKGIVFRPHEPGSDVVPF